MADDRAQGSREIILRLRGVGLAYRKPRALPWSSNRFWAVEDVSFDLHRGDTLGIIGRNGAGKSSLLKLIAGIVEPDRGEIDRRCDATLLSLGAGFTDLLTGRQNIMLSGLQLGIDARRIRRAIPAIIELTGIGGYIDEPVKTYSHGMRGRLGFAIAYHIESELLLIDEVLAAGDPRFRETAKDLLKRKIEAGVSVVFVSHSMPLVRDLCQRVLRIEQGRSLEEDAVEESIREYLASNASPARLPGP